MAQPSRGLRVLLAVATTLGFGIYSMFRGGEYGRKWSTKLMSLRVGLQAVAIAIIVAAILFRGGH